MAKATEKRAKREANVLVELRMQDAMSEEVLDANSDDVLDAVEQYAANVALGPAIALNLQDCSIKLRFDVLGQTDAQIHRQVAKVIATIERHTDLAIVASRSNVEAHSDDVETSEFTAC